MDKLSYALGVVILIMSFVLRISFPEKTAQPQLQDSKYKRMPFDAVTLMGLMGIYWIGLGFILNLIEGWLAASFLRDVIVPPILTFIPFLGFRRFVDKYRRDK